MAKKRVPSVTKTQLIDLFQSELLRVGIKFDYDGKSTKGNQSFVQLMFELLLDNIAAAVVSGDRVALNGYGTFWQVNGRIKFRGSTRYQSAIKGFLTDIKKSEDFRESFHRFLSYLKVQDSQKTVRQATVDKLTELMGE